MSQNRVHDLKDCTEFRQTLEARPPRLVHGSALLSVALLGTAVLWAGLTNANLVVRSSGRIRPITTPAKVVYAGRGEAGGAGRVVEVNCRPGDAVRKGDVLVRLDADRVDNEMAKRRRMIRADEEEVARLRRLTDLLAAEHEAARTKAEAESKEVEDELRQVKEQQAKDVRLAEVEVASAQDDSARIEHLCATRAAAPADLVKAGARLQEATARLEKAKVPNPEGKLAVQHQTLILTEKEYAGKGEELAMKLAAKQGEVEDANVELANLDLEHQNAILHAPVDGIVTEGDVKTGDVLEPGKMVMEIAEQKGFHFEALVPSEEVGHLQVGMPAHIKLDAYDYQKYGTLNGTVCFLSPDSGVKEGEPKAYYLVKIDLEEEEVSRGGFRGPIKLGLAGQAELVSGQESLLVLLVKNLRQSISLQ